MEEMEKIMQAMDLMVKSLGSLREITKTINLTVGTLVETVVAQERTIEVLHARVARLESERMMVQFNGPVN